MPKSQEGLARLIDKEALADPRIAHAFRAVARRDFVPSGYEKQAYEDRPIGLPGRQTTSQPSLIARMIDAAAPKDTDRVLEVGSGYGFQTALLARLAAEVVAIERLEELARATRDNLTRAGYSNVEVLVGDGWQGVPDRAPFDAIIVSAAATEVPAPLVEQLAEGGRLVIPVKGAIGDDVQLFEKRNGELVRIRLITPARFVPLVPGPIK